MREKKAHTIFSSSVLRGSLHLFVFFVGFFFSTVVFAEGETGSTNCNFDKFGEALAGRESSGRYDLENSFGYLGKYQFGTETLHDLGFYNGPTSARYQDWSGPWNGPMAQRFGITSKQDFLNSREAQEYVFQQNQSYLWRQIQSKGLDRYVGQTINGVTITESSLLAGCHLKGCGGLNKCLNGTGSCTDGYGTNVFEYLQRFAGYNTPWGGGGDCKQYANTASPRGITYGDPRCAESMKARIDEQVKAASAMRQDAWQNTYRPPVSSAALMKVPCKSNELQRISNQFAYAPTGYASNILGQVSGAAGPVSGLLNNMVKGDIQSFMNTSKDFGGLFKDIGNLVQGQLSSLLSSIPGLSGSPFASALCGIMADTLLKYIQCEVPINMPSLGNISGSLNKLLPKGCAGDALRSALYASASQSAFRPLNQSIGGVQGGIFSTVQAPRLTPLPSNSQ